MIGHKRIDFDHTTTFNPCCVSMSTSYQIKAPLSDHNMLDVVYLGMRDVDGNFVEVPCTYVAAELIRLYPSHTMMTLYISPTVIDNDMTDELELVPLVIGAVRAR